MTAQITEDIHQPDKNTLVNLKTNKCLVNGLFAICGKKITIKELPDNKIQVNATDYIPPKLFSSGEEAMKWFLYTEN